MIETLDGEDRVYIEDIASRNEGLNPYTVRRLLRIHDAQQARIQALELANAELGVELATARNEVAEVAVERDAQAATLRRVRAVLDLSGGIVCEAVRTALATAPAAKEEPNVRQYDGHAWVRADAHNARVAELERLLQEEREEVVMKHAALMGTKACTPAERKVLDALAELSDEWLRSDWATWRKPADAELARRAEVKEEPTTVCWDSEKNSLSDPGAPVRRMGP